MTHPPADRFRPGETWASPRGTHWYVVRVNDRGGAVLRNVCKPSSTQRRAATATGNNMSDAWWRIDPPSDP